MFRNITDKFSEGIMDLLQRVFHSSIFFLEKKYERFEADRASENYCNKIKTDSLTDDKYYKNSIQNNK